MTIPISIYCPAMKVYRVKRGVWRTAVEPMTATIAFPDGDLVIENVVIPETDVHLEQLLPLRFMVDACVGDSGDVDPRLVTELPEEPVDIFPVQGFGIFREIAAPTTLKWAGKTYRGLVTFPEGKFRLLGGTAEAVTATGTLEEVPAL